MRQSKKMREPAIADSLNSFRLDNVKNPALGTKLKRCNLAELSHPKVEIVTIG